MAEKKDWIEFRGLDRRVERVLKYDALLPNADENSYSLDLRKAGERSLELISAQIVSVLEGNNHLIVSYGGSKTFSRGLTMRTLFEKLVKAGELNITSSEELVNVNAIPSDVLKAKFLDIGWVNETQMQFGYASGDRKDSLHISTNGWSLCESDYKLKLTFPKIKPQIARALGIEEKLEFYISPNGNTPHELSPEHIPDGFDWREFSELVILAFKRMYDLSTLSELKEEYAEAEIIEPAQVLIPRIDFGLSAVEFKPGELKPGVYDGKVVRGYNLHNMLQGDHLDAKFDLMRGRYQTLLKEYRKLFDVFIKELYGLKNNAFQAYGHPRPK